MTFSSSYVPYASPPAPGPFAASAVPGASSAALDPTSVAIDAARTSLDSAARTLAAARIDAWAGYAADAYRQRVDRIDARLAQAERLVGVARCESQRLAELLVAAGDEYRRMFAAATA